MREIKEQEVVIHNVEEFKALAHYVEKDGWR